MLPLPVLYVISSFSFLILIINNIFICCRVILLNLFTCFRSLRCSCALHLCVCVCVLYLLWLCFDFLLFFFLCVLSFFDGSRAIDFPFRHLRSLARVHFNSFIARLFFACYLPSLTLAQLDHSILYISFNLVFCDAVVCPVDPFAVRREFCHDARLGRCCRQLR